MGEFDLHSFISACDFRVDDVDRMRKSLNEYCESLASIGAHHMELYTSIWEPGGVMVTMGTTQFVGRFAHLTSSGERV
jgi:hypothetical protein